MDTGPLLALLVLLGPLVALGIVVFIAIRRKKKRQYYDIIKQETYKIPSEQTV